MVRIRSDGWWIKLIKYIFYEMVIVYKSYIFYLKNEKKKLWDIFFWIFYWNIIKIVNVIDYLILGSEIF